MKKTSTKYPSDYVNASSSGLIRNELKMLYSIDAGSNGYKGHRIIVMFTDTSNSRYLWITSSISQALRRIPENKYISLKYNIQERLNGGDIKIERVQIDE